MPQMRTEYGSRKLHDSTQNKRPDGDEKIDPKGSKMALSFFRKDATPLR